MKLVPSRVMTAVSKLWKSRMNKLWKRGPAKNWQRCSFGRIRMRIEWISCWENARETLRQLFLNWKLGLDTRGTQNSGCFLRFLFVSCTSMRNTIWPGDLFRDASGVNIQLLIVLSSPSDVNSNVHAATYDLPCFFCVSQCYCLGKEAVWWLGGIQNPSAGLLRKSVHIANFRLQAFAGPVRTSDLPQIISMNFKVESIERKLIKILSWAEVLTTGFKFLSAPRCTKWCGDVVVVSISTQKFTVPHSRKSVRCFGSWEPGKMQLQLCYSIVVALNEK